MYILLLQARARLPHTQSGPRRRVGRGTAMAEKTGEGQNYDQFDFV